MNKYQILVFVLLLFSSTINQATTVQGLYEGTVALADTSSGAQARAIRSVLLQVLVKLTGKRTAASIYGVDSILDEPTRYLQQYEVKSMEDEGELSHRLWAKFDPVVLQSSMREYSIPIWSQERPTTLIWMVQNDGQGLQFANISPDSVKYDSLMHQAKSRGIDFLIPQLDSTDRSQLSEQAIVAESVEQIRSASSRYSPDTILSATINQLGSNLWQIQWLSEINGQLAKWQTSGSSISEALSEGVDTHADRLASIYSQPIGYAAESSFSIKVEGIRSFNDYAKTLKYLQSLNFISDISTIQANKQNIVYQLTADGNIQTLEQAVTLGQTLQPIGDGETFLYIP